MLNVYWFSDLMLCICRLCHFVCDSPYTALIRYDAFKMASQASTVVRQVKPILSVNREDARRKVLTLYKAWIRQVPITLLSYDIPKTEADCKQKIREEFKRHAHLTDLRIIDKLIIKGQMELQEVANVWKTKGGVMHYWKETWEKKPTDFMSKFLNGQD